MKILPSLVIVDIAMFFYLLSKGLGSTKIKAFFSILKMYSRIKKRQSTLSKLKTVSDKKIIEQFVDFVEIPQNMEENPSNFLSRSLESLSKLTRKII